MRSYTVIEQHVEAITPPEPSRPPGQVLDDGECVEPDSESEDEPEEPEEPEDEEQE